MTLELSLLSLGATGLRLGLLFGEFTLASLPSRDVCSRDEILKLSSESILSFLIGLLELEPSRERSYKSFRVYR